MDQRETNTSPKVPLESHALRADVVRRLRKAQEDLQSAGVLHVAIFGSVARGEADSESDVDIIVDLDPAACVGLFKFVEIQQRLSTLMQREVDVVSRKGIRPGRGASVLRDAIEVF